MKQFLLPYYNERPENKINALVLHCSAQSVDDMINVLIREKLSCHYIVGLEGEIIQVVPEDKRAWHAGVSLWRGMNNLNHNSIGIEVSSLSMGQEKYSDKQIEALLSLCKDIVSKYEIPAENIVGHSDIAPERKPDPGVAFPWQYFAQNGVGLWYDIKDAEKVTECNIEKLLAGIGYNVNSLDAAIYAFCRHFFPEIVEKKDCIGEVIEYPFEKINLINPQLMSTLQACWLKYNKNIDKMKD